MKINRIAWLISAAALALLALIGFQVSWMNHSRLLLNEQFNNQVNMALCTTVEKLAADPDCSEKLRACCAKENKEGCRKSFEAISKTPEMTSAFREAMRFYQINLPYELQIAAKDTNSNCAKKAYACSLQPILSDDSHQIEVEFKGKAEFILQRMGLMVSSSIAILLLICAIFGLSAYYMLRQKRISDRNIDFFNHMTHEFRTPLTNIRLASTMLLKKQSHLADDPYVGIIRKECSHLTDQVENVLHLSSLEKGDYKLQKSSLELQHLAEEVVHSMDLQIKERAAVVHIQQPPTPVVVLADAFHMGNALRNLLDNALKYSGEKPVVHIEFATAAKGAILTVRDNGIGFSEKDCNKVFQKFHRCENAVYTGEKGFGLGLAYVKKIVDLHQGNITVKSAPGQGARFDIFIPAR